MTTVSVDALVVVGISVAVSVPVAVDVYILMKPKSYLFFRNTLDISNKSIPNSKIITWR